MARSQTSAGAAYAWALVLFGTAFLLCLILAIVFYTRSTGLRQQAQSAESDLDQFVNRAQRDSSDVTNLMSNLGPNQTVVGKLMQNNRQLKQIVAGDPSLTVEAIKQQKNQTRKIDQNLFATVQQLRTKVDDLNTQIENKDQALAKARNAVKTAQQEKNSLAQDFTSARQKLKSNFTSTAGSFEQMTSNQQDKWQQLKDQFATERQNLQDKINQQSSTIDEQTQRIQVVESQLDKSRSQRSQAIGPSGVVPADGEIVSLLPNSNKVYINRGSDDYVQLGMTFEVFEADKNIKLNDYDELRGKATIEVTSLNEQSATARIVRSKPNANISPNDKFANLVYDPNATYKFYVYGDFNIDDQGQATTQDRRRIKSMIRRWDGEISDKLNWDVDFLVLGQEPETPKPLDPNELDPEVIAQQKEAQKKYQRYQDLQKKAQDLSIPVLNQNRLLALVGYYRR